MTKTRKLVTKEELSFMTRTEFECYDNWEFRCEVCGKVAPLTEDKARTFLREPCYVTMEEKEFGPLS